MEVEVTTDISMKKEGDRETDVKEERRARTLRTRANKDLFVNRGTRKRTPKTTRKTQRIEPSRDEGKALKRGGFEALRALIW